MAGYNLFDRGPLPQTDGVIAERWQQDGSSPVSVTDTIQISETVYTVSAGKKLFVKSIIVNNKDSGNANYNLKDGGSGGTVKFSFSTQSNSNNAFVFDVPIIFDTNIYCTSTGTNDIYLTVTGWEESE